MTKTMTNTSGNRIMKAALALCLCASLASAAQPFLPGQAPPRSAERENPMAGDARAQKAGAKLFDRECASCHGADATGIGKTPSLRRPAISGARPGALDWVIKNGGIFHGMPSFAHLPQPERWQLVTFLQS